MFAKTNHLEQRHEGFRSYLDALLSETAQSPSLSGFSQKAVFKTWTTWDRIRDRFLSEGQQLEVPNACPGEHDNIMMVWSRDEHYLECEIFGDGRREFFYRHRSSGDNLEIDLASEEEEGQDVYTLLSVFTL